MPVLERAREEDAVGIRCAFELLPVVAEADDHRPRVDAAQRLEQDVNALVVEQLPEVDDRGLVSGKEGCEALGVPLVRQALVGVPRVLAGRAAHSATRPASASSRGRGLHSSMSTPGGTSCTRSTWPTTSSSTPRMWAEPTKTASAPASAALPHAASSGLPRIEYSSSEPCALTDVRRSGRGGDRPAEEDVVREHEVSGQSLANCGGVRLHPPVELVARAVLEQLDLVALVAVEDERRQQPADVGPDDLRPAEVVQLRVRLLAEHDHVVPRPGPLARELPRVHVRPRTTEEVPVPEQNPHETAL